MHRKRIPGGEVLAGLDPPARSQPVRLEVEGQCELSRDRFCNSSTIICVHAVFLASTTSLLVRVHVCSCNFTPLLGISSIT